MGRMGFITGGCSCADGGWGCGGRKATSIAPFPGIPLASNGEPKERSVLTDGRLGATAEVSIRSTAKAVSPLSPREKAAEAAPAASKWRNAQTAVNIIRIDSRGFNGKSKPRFLI
jgi:hypothetical protein